VSPNGLEMIVLIIAPGKKPVPLLFEALTNRRAKLCDSYNTFKAFSPAAR
jgi:hypothetical protein